MPMFKFTFQGKVKEFNKMLDFANSVATDLMNLTLTTDAPDVEAIIDPSWDWTLPEQWREE